MRCLILQKKVIRMRKDSQKLLKQTITSHKKHQKYLTKLTWDLSGRSEPHEQNVKKIRIVRTKTRINCEKGNNILKTDEKRSEEKEYDLKTTGIGPNCIEPENVSRQNLFC